MLSSSATVQHDETERLKTLLQYEILDTLPDPAFDEIARMAGSICNAPYAFIGFLDWSRVWFNSFYSMANHSSLQMLWKTTGSRRQALCWTTAYDAVRTRALLCSLLPA
jgi:hypothetical protein